MVKKRVYGVTPGDPFLNPSGFIFGSGPALDASGEHFGFIFAPCGRLLVSTSNFDSENNAKLAFPGAANVVEM